VAGIAINKTKMPRQIPIPKPDFNCKNPRTWIKIEIRKIERNLESNLGFMKFDKSIDYERKLETLNSYL
jgi:hypothetical protein